MEMVLYTIAALLLYAVSDYILNTIEIKLQKRLPNRSLVFFVIIATLSVSTFAVIQMIYKGQSEVQTTDSNQVTPTPAATNPPQSTQPRIQAQPAAPTTDIKTGN
ncbi:MAG: hypothetical protein OQL16_03625 [Gammaproteobacteria bacterium]|nr:hypothetical protein [Gammaproteobacteria bacterium]